MPLAARGQETIVDPWTASERGAGCLSWPVPKTYLGATAL